MRLPGRPTFLEFVIAPLLAVGIFSAAVNAADKTPLPSPAKLGSPDGPMKACPKLRNSPQAQATVAKAKAPKTLVVEPTAADRDALQVEVENLLAVCKEIAAFDAAVRSCPKGNMGGRTEVRQIKTQMVTTAYGTPEWKKLMLWASGLKVACSRPKTAPK